MDLKGSPVYRWTWWSRDHRLLSLRGFVEGTYDSNSRIIFDYDCLTKIPIKKII